MLAWHRTDLVILASFPFQCQFLQPTWPQSFSAWPDRPMFQFPSRLFQLPLIPQLELTFPACELAYPPSSILFWHLPLGPWVIYSICLLPARYRRKGSGVHLPLPSPLVLSNTEPCSEATCVCGMWVMLAGLTGTGSREAWPSIASRAGIRTVPRCCRECEPAQHFWRTSEWLSVCLSTHRTTVPFAREQEAPALDVWWLHILNLRLRDSVESTWQNGWRPQERGTVSGLLVSFSSQSSTLPLYAKETHCLWSALWKKG